MGHFVLQGVLDHYTMYKTAFSKKLNFLKKKKSTRPDIIIYINMYVNMHLLDLNLK